VKKLIIEYLYRDAANYKLFGEAEIKNPRKLDALAFEKWMRSIIIDEIYFIPEKFNVPSLRFPDCDPILDHDYCELVRIREK
jgi:hypothetical protein